MNGTNHSGGFSYTYSAEEQAQVRHIRDKYTTSSPEEDKLSRLRRLDAGVTQAAQTVALIFGVLGSLILGLGMSLIMTELGSILSIRPALATALGLLLGILGGALACLAYPVYHAIVKHRRKQLAPQILLLADELLKQ